MKFGMAMAARMPMIATTIISSIRVKPRDSFFIGGNLLDSKRRSDDADAPSCATTVPSTSERNCAEALGDLPAYTPADDPSLSAPDVAGHPARRCASSLPREADPAKQKGWPAQG